MVNFKEISIFEQRKRESQILNILAKLSWIKPPSYLIIMGDYLQFSNKISAEVPIIKYSLPNQLQVESIINQFLENNQIIDNSFPNIQRLIIACQGLPRGEIKLVLKTYLALTSNLQELANLIVKYKIDKLRGLGLEFIAEPEIEIAGGLDNLRHFLEEKVVKLNEPSAKKYQLRPPRGMLLLGPPGTGKTLSAKLAAKALGYSLLALSWGNVIGSDNPDQTLAKILEIADSLDRVILLADDFDKGFTGWESGGISRRLSQRLLTWMQEHTSNVMMIATVNRIHLLPSEIKRRFDDGGIWFVDLPSMGEMYEIFMIYLAKFFPCQFGNNKNSGNDRQWYLLLKQYRGATAVEIKNAVTRCAQDFYCNLSPKERQIGAVFATVTIEQLIKQLDYFEMASKRDSEDLQAIRNSAYYARPASSKDNSKFALSSQELFEYNPHQLEQ